MFYSFILTTLAGFTTLLGLLPIFVKFKRTDNLLAIACSFASGVMLAISILDLVPGAISYFSFFSNAYITILLTFFMMFLGIIISLLFEYLIDQYSSLSSLYNVGLLSMLIIILHNIPEGIVTFTVSSHNITLGIPIALAIALHNIPEGISIAIPIYYASGSKFKAIIYTLISAFSELMGGLITYLFLKNYINDIILGIIFSFTAGLMIAISLDKLLPTGKQYNHNLAHISLALGFIFMFFSLQLNNLIS